MSEATFRPMERKDVPRALEIIGAHDEDDRKEAKRAYRYSLEHQYAFCVEGQVAGVTGGNPIEGTDDSWWLSWTYLAAEFRGRGLGREMLGLALKTMADGGARKIFLTTSSLETEDGQAKYGAAIRAYTSAGFEHLARHEDFYVPGEAMIVMGRRVRPAEEVEHEPEHRPIVIGKATEIAETDDAYAFDWRYVEEEEDGTTAAELEEAVEDLREDEARVVFVGLPSDTVAGAEFLQAAGFRNDGTLLDFYEDGLHELRWRLDL